MSEDIEETLDAEVPEEQEDAVEPQEVVEDDGKDYKVIARDQKIRAEKAEKELKRLQKQKEEPKEEPTSGYSLRDIKALSNVHEDDVEKIEKFAKTEGISIAEAMKHEDLQAILKHRAELRQSAEVTSTGKVKKGATKLADEQIVAAAYEGKEVDPVELAKATHALRLKKPQ